MKFPLTLNTVIHVGPCRIHIIGHRSRKGWNIAVDGKLQDHRKTKKDAIKLAQDACEPGIRATVTVHPADYKPS